MSEQTISEPLDAGSRPSSSAAAASDGQEARGPRWGVLGEIDVATIAASEREQFRVRLVHVGHAHSERRTWGQNHSPKRTYIRIARWQRSSPDDCWARSYEFSIPIRNADAVASALRQTVEQSNLRNWR